MKYSSNLVIFSHSNPRALKGHPWNIPDELMRDRARTGSVVNLNGIGIFLGDNQSCRGAGSGSRRSVAALGLRRHRKL